MLSSGTFGKLKLHRFFLQFKSEIRQSIDLSGWGTFSLRVGNTLKDENGNIVSCNATLQFDQYGNSYNTKNAAGENVNIELPYGYVFITPEDYPLFNYLASIHLSVKADVTPASGAIQIFIVKKR